jgi:hypothetical protein
MNKQQTASIVSIIILIIATNEIARMLFPDLVGTLTWQRRVLYDFVIGGIVAGIVTIFVPQFFNNK